MNQLKYRDIIESITDRNDYEAMNQLKYQDIIDLIKDRDYCEAIEEIINRPVRRYKKFIQCAIASIKIEEFSMALCTMLDICSYDQISVMSDLNEALIHYYVQYVLDNKKSISLLQGELLLSYIPIQHKYTVFRPSFEAYIWLNFKQTKIELPKHLASEKEHLKIENKHRSQKIGDDANDFVFETSYRNTLSNKIMDFRVNQFFLDRIMFDEFDPRGFGALREFEGLDFRNCLTVKHHEWSQGRYSSIIPYIRFHLLRRRIASYEKYLTEFGTGKEIGQLQHLNSIIVKTRKGLYVMLIKFRKDIKLSLCEICHI